MTDLFRVEEDEGLFSKDSLPLGTRAQIHILLGQAGLINLRVIANTHTYTHTTSCTLYYKYASLNPLRYSKMAATVQYATKQSPSS